MNPSLLEYVLGNESIPNKGKGVGAPYTQFP